MNIYTELSDKKRLEIANICYANVSSNFAMFTNPKFRGENFKWENFSEMMIDMSKNWRIIHNVKGNKELIDFAFESFAKEISDTLLKRAELITVNKIKP